MPACAIAVPVWKVVLGLDEVKSLVQCRCVLGGNANYEIVLFGPKRLDWNYYRSLWSACPCGDRDEPEIAVFDDRCFESRDAYSRLLSAKDFYGRFSGYGHVLLYQLDAWVFRDELSEWCDAGYDYVGAPWCHLCRMGKGGCSGYESTGFVGNGGLSLRNVKSFVNALPYDTFDDVVYAQGMNEDLYVSMVGGLRKPPCSEAARFSVEANAAWLIDNRLGGNLPFGFHGLRVYDGGLFDDLVAKTFAGSEVMEKAFGKPETSNAN